MLRRYRIYMERLCHGRDLGELKLSDEEITRFASINPIEFLGLKENGEKLPG